MINYNFQKGDKVTFLTKEKGLVEGKFIKRNQVSIKVEFENREINIRFKDLYSVTRVETGEVEHLEMEYNLKKNEIIEFCPYCNNEAILKNKQEIQVCKYCLNKIKPCSLCDMDNVKCNKCYLDDN